MAKDNDQQQNLIVLNKRAGHEYFLEDRFEGGLVLEGWEVKSLRAGKVQISDSYLIIKNGAVWLFGAHITPLPTAATHTNPDPVRTRKLLLHQKEISKLIGLKERKGYTLIPISLYWKKNRIKLNFAIAKGKQLHDKRDTEKKRDWQREKARVMRSVNKNR